MRLDAPVLRNLAIIGVLFSAIGGWLLLSETSSVVGAIILIIGAFLFLFGRRGSILLMEKDIDPRSKPPGE